MAKQVIREYKTEVKLAKNIYASDFGFISAFVILAYLIGDKFVNSRFMLPYILFSVIVGLLLIRRSRQNPRIRVYQELSRLIRRDPLSYGMFYADEYIKEVSDAKKEE